MGFLFSIVLFAFKSKKVALGLVLMCFCETAKKSELIPSGGVGKTEKTICLCEVQDVKPDIRTIYFMVVLKGHIKTEFAVLVAVGICVVLLPQNPNVGPEDQYPSQINKQTQISRTVCKAFSYNLDPPLLGGGGEVVRGGNEPKSVTLNILFFPLGAQNINSSASS